MPHAVKKNTDFSRARAESHAANRSPIPRPMMSDERRVTGDGRPATGDV